VTIANGSDNIGIYIPLFATLIMPQKAIMIFIFFVMVAVWCFIAKYLSKHPTIARTIDRYGHIITPIVLIALGIYILIESKTFQLL
jgi:cadmium resistance protein CadD (predicted permease)